MAYKTEIYFCTVLEAEAILSLLEAVREGSAPGLSLVAAGCLHGHGVASLFV